LEDLGSRFDGAPDLEFRSATAALELEKSGLSYQRVPPGYRFPYGHTHKKQEEVYVVLRGSGRMKVDDEIVELKEWDAVRVPPGTWRGYEAGPEGLEILVVILLDSADQDPGERHYQASVRLPKPRDSQHRLDRASDHPGEKDADRGTSTGATQPKAPAGKQSTP